MENLASSEDGLHLLEHVQVVVFLFPIRAQADGDALRQHVLNPCRAAGQLHITDRVMRHTDAMFCQNLDLMVRKPDAVGKQHLRRIQQTKGFERFDRTHIETTQCFLHVELALIAVGMEAGLIMPRHFNDPLIGLRRGIKHMLQPDPYMYSSIRSAVPFLDQSFIGIERLEIIMVGMLRHIRHQDRPDPQLLRGLGTAVHMTPHIHDGRRPREKRLRITEPGSDLRLPLIHHAVHRVNELLQPLPDGQVPPPCRARDPNGHAC